MRKEAASEGAAEEVSNLPELGSRMAKKAKGKSLTKPQKATALSPTNDPNNLVNLDGSNNIGSGSGYPNNNQGNQGNQGNNQRNQKIGHEELYNLITGDEISWQALIYDLIRSEQLDPLDIDIVLLTRNFLEKIRQIEQANFFVSGRVLLAAAILLRMKSERLYEQLLLFDELLLGRKEQEIEEEQQRFFLSHEELPIILPKTPLPRLRKVTIEELMQALERAIEVEERRQRRVEAIMGAEREAAIVLPVARININEKIRELYRKIREFFTKQLSEQLTFSELVGSERREDKIATFIPLLHLDAREKITLEQQEAFGEIYIYLFKRLPEAEGTNI